MLWIELCVEAVGCWVLRLWALLLSLAKSLFGGCGLIDSVVGCGWWLAVAMRGGLTLFAWRRETHTEKERDMSHGGKKGIINNK